MDDLPEARCQHGNIWGMCCGDTSETRQLDHMARDFSSGTDALGILKEASDCIQSRAILRDTPGERAMAKSVRAFNELTGHNLSEKDGNFFLVCLKASRAYSGHDKDNYIDGSAYFALAGEASGNEDK